MDTIEFFNQILAKTEGRDKVYRLGQYGGRFLGAVLSQKRHSKETQDLGARITKASGLLSDGRKLFRLWKWANEIPKLPQLLNARESMTLKCLNVGKVCGGGVNCVFVWLVQIRVSPQSMSTLLYFLFDNYIWILKTQLVKGDQTRASQRAGFFWFMSLVLQIIVDALAVSKGKGTPARYLTLVKNVCDTPIAANAAARGSLSAKISGLLGIGSSVIGLYQVASK
jgi:hypothetical protein